ncbi:unnamed protein product [Miscanthus lutarioriparius]|uniref:Uncharacterized protein n=1 Tax=Miscanthus lutarioriparius TaxID=422564 RepID=A0A811SJ63_9POAL|nr:unnamed protein product [Miscanthus lutarioriparius]
MPLSRVAADDGSGAGVGAGRPRLFAVPRLLVGLGAPKYGAAPPDCDPAPALAMLRCRARQFVLLVVLRCRAGVLAVLGSSSFQRTAAPGRACACARVGRRPPGFPASGDPPTPPLPGSSIADEDFMILQRRAPLVEVPPPAVHQAQPTEGATAVVPKNATKPKKSRKHEREEGADADVDASPDAVDTVGEPKKRKKKKKLSDLDGAGKAAAVVQDPNGLDLTQSPKKKKPAALRPGAGNNDPTKAGVKRGPLDRQGELTVKKKAKLEKIKTLPSEKKAAGLEQKDTAAAQQQAARAAGGKDSKAEMGGGAAAKKKEPAPAPRVRTPSPTALMMKFPLKSTLPSVASLKARFARFGPLDVDGFRVYWKSHMCRVIYRFKADAEAALRYAEANAMFGQVDTQYHLREVESRAGRDPPLAAPEAPEAPPPQQPQRSELRLMETASFRPGSSGNDAPLPMSRAAGAVPAHPAVGQQEQPKSILKKSTDEGNSGTTREPLQPPMRPALQQQQQAPRAAVTQQLPPSPPLSLQQHLPYHQPRVADGHPLVSPQGQLLAYPPPRVHGEGPCALPGQPLPPLPYQPRPTGFPGGQQQQQVGYPPRSGDSPLLLAGQQQQQLPPRPSNANAAEEVPAWKRGEKEFKEEVWRLMTGKWKILPLTPGHRGAKGSFYPSVTGCHALN